MKRVVLLFVWCSFLISCNEAYSDGQDLAKNLCENYDSSTGKFELHGAYAIKITDNYIYFVPDEYPDFRAGFLDYLADHCQESSEQLKHWRGLYENSVPKDSLSSVAPLGL